MIIFIDSNVIIKAFVDNKDTEKWQLDKNLLFEAFKRDEKYNLDTFDLINYTTALLNNCSEIVSYDRDFDGLEIKRVEA